VSVVHGGTVDYNCGIQLVVNRWQHVVVTRAGSTIKCYLDSVLKNSSTSFSGTFTTASGSVRIGNSGAYNEPFPGKLDDARIYNRALTATEVSQLYQLGISKFNATPTQPLTSGLVGHWTMDGKDTVWSSATAGTIVNKAGGSTGTLFTNMARATAQVPGKIGQALNFDGTDDYIDTNLPTNTYDISTLAGWFKATGDITGNDFCRYRIASTARTSTTSRLGLGINTSNLCGFGYTAGLFTLEGNTTLVAGRWYHGALTYDGTYLRLYLNGVQDMTPYSLGTIDAASVDDMVVGKTAGTSRYFNGALDDVRAYNRVLSDTEILQLYNLGASKFNATPTQPLTSGLVGHWTFDGKDSVWSDATTGSFTDRSGNGNTGSDVNMERATAPVAGKIGQAMKFDGVDEAMDAGTASAMQIVGPITVSAWINPTSFNATNASSRPYIASTRVSGAGGWLFSLDNFNTTAGLVFGYGTGTGTNYPYSTANVITLNKWQHVVATYDNSTSLKYYVDGVEVSPAVGVTGSLTTSTSNFYIGRNNTGTRPFDGKIDDVRVYNRVLSATEVQQLYNMGR
jgi:hypothetical protein